MGLGEFIEHRLSAYRQRRRERLPGALGEFYRRGGPDQLLAGMDLSSDDIVLDVGGYLGNWTAEVAWRYGSRSIILEAVPAFQAELRKRFGENRRIEVVEAGLAANDGSATLTLNADGTSAFAAGPSGETVQAKMLGVESIFRQFDLHEVGCMKVNIEGGEFEVLRRMLELGLQRSVRTFLIQFHRVANDSDSARLEIRAGLARTHICEFDYPFVWERWRRA